MHSAIYEGWVRHRRSAPVANAFRYRLFMLYLDLAELPRVFAGTPLYSNEGRACARFRRADHLGPADQPLDDAVRALVANRLHRPISGPVRLLTHLEYFRYRFNPVSFYYCFSSDAARLEAIVAEINNTPWNEQHCYVLDCASANPGVARFSFDKDFHVSPFMGMRQRYDWRFTAPGERLAVHMNNLERGDKLFDATLMLTRQPLTPRALNLALVRFPLMTARVIAAIHWQALKLWLKRCPYHPHPRTAAAQPEGAP